MPTLYLSAPKGKTQPGTHRKDFFTILANRVGPDYAIHRNLIAQLHSGIHVVVFDRDRQLRAEGVVSNYNPTTRTGNGLQRYDVRIPDLTRVPYTNAPRVNRCGVAVI